MALDPVVVLTVPSSFSKYHLFQAYCLPRTCLFANTPEGIDWTTYAELLLGFSPQNLFTAWHLSPRACSHTLLLNLFHLGTTEYPPQQSSAFIFSYTEVLNSSISQCMLSPLKEVGEDLLIKKCLGHIIFFISLLVRHRIHEHF